ncbi:hypothetical protein RHSIM_Rhsim04G0108700 [Rhododendron simsii]|uniref:Xylanase inhibitor C-terminal domain-containing protein n=1 Tax=Rhododendron simsii TaxID=118357 RepID=A0A834HC29_RHOSS|nr:hypothetical protein RHSIM_Rhsim04G0108700 [Rhododendron simsii]
MADRLDTAQSLEGSIPLQHDAVVRLYIYQGGRRLLPDYKSQRGPSSEGLLFSSSKQRPHCNLNLKSISINGQTLGIYSSIFAISSNKRTIVDSGTTLAYIAEEAFNPFVSGVNHDREQWIKCLAGAAVWCIGFQKIDGQEINDFRRYAFVRKVKSVTQFNSNMVTILGLESVVSTKLPQVVWECSKESMKCNSS